MSELIQKWHEAKVNLDHYKDVERKLRDQVVDEYFNGALGNECTLKHDLGEGYSLKCVTKLNRTVDEAGLALYRESFEFEDISEDRLIRKKLELNLREYNALTDQQKLVFDHALVVKPAAPTLELVRPK